MTLLSRLPKLAGSLAAALVLLSCRATAITPPSADPGVFDLPTGSVVVPERQPIVPQTIRLEPLTQAQLARHSVKVAAVQITGTWFYPNINGNGIDPADAVVSYIEKAAKDGVELIAFPELYLGMYRLPHPSTDKIAAAAKKHSIYVVVGLMEVTDDAGTHFNSSLVFDRQGQIIGRYNKSHAALGEGPYLWPPVPNDPEWVFTEGSDFPVFDLDFGRVGITTCYDGYFPEPWRILSLKGAEIIIWMNARGGAVEDYMVRTHMQHGLTHIITTNKAVGAGTMIAQWPNSILAELKEPKEGYISATLPLNLLRNARRNDRQLIQRRPWVYTELMHHYDVAAAYANMEPLPGTPPDPMTARPAAEGIGATLTRPDVSAPIALGITGLPAGLQNAAISWSRVPESGELFGTITGEGLSARLSIYPRRELAHLELTVSNGGNAAVTITPGISVTAAPSQASAEGKALLLGAMQLVLEQEGGARASASGSALTAAGTNQTIQPGTTARWRSRLVVVPNQQGAVDEALKPDYNAWSSRLP